MKKISKFLLAFSLVILPVMFPATHAHTKEFFLKSLFKKDRSLKSRLYKDKLESKSFDFYDQTKDAFISLKFKNFEYHKYINSASVYMGYEPIPIIYRSNI